MAIPKMFIQIFKTVFIVFFIFSCNEVDKSYSNKAIVRYTENDFDKHKSLIHKEVSKVSNSLFRPSRMEIIDDYLVILDAKSEQTLHLINLIRESYVGSYINKGQGPGEIMLPWGVSKIDDESFSVYDAMSKKIIGLNIDSLINGGNQLFEKKLNENGLCSSFSIVKDDIYYLRELNSKNRIFKVNTITGKEEGFGNLLNNYKNVTDVNFAQACRALMTSHKDKIVTAYKLAPFFEIFDLKTNDWKSILVIDDFSPIFKEIAHEGYLKFALTKDTRLGMIDISLTKKYIYLLYSGEKMLDSKIDIGKTILVFDYNGNPISIYDLDKNLSSFKVYNDSIIYGIHRDIKANILKYTIN